MPRPLPLVAFFASLLASFRIGVTQAANATACNGQSSFCDRSYGNITFVGAHDSPNVQAGSVGANQNYTVTTQLDNGIRLLTAQGHNESGVIHLCHTICLLLDKGPAVNYLKEVKSWLDSNPDEVITILWVNSDDLPVSAWASVYEQAGMVNYSYVPSSTPVAMADWPTLQTMISAGTRVVSFIDNGAAYSSVPYILDEFSMIWETPYDETDNSFPCTVNRISSSATSTNIMYAMNHFLEKNLTLLGSQITVPDTAALATTNGQNGTGSLGLQAVQCAEVNGHYPNFMLVDYYDVPTDGSVFKVAASLNGVTWNGTIGNGSYSSSSSSSPSSSTSNASGMNGIRRVVGMTVGMLVVGTIVVLVGG